MITVTKKQIVDFINAQPASRRVNMSQNYSYESVGCIMIHYGKEVLKLAEFGCGFNAWNTGVTEARIVKEDGSDLSITEIVGSWHGIVPMDNYGDLQKILGASDICTAQ